ncbi:Ligand-binding domain of nuclear hormone receptor [Trichostrongylus colubriformis]|uniref:Ligand-binding domain of nuclear hormone receptor n=1 Tax=Trichostrongylus colubriformis TaxID=6319 RepID=A0AAN8G1N2_TRICO
MASKTNCNRHCQNCRKAWPPRMSHSHDDADNDDHEGGLRIVTFEQQRFPTSLFGHRIAMNSDGLDVERLLTSFNNLELYCDAPDVSPYTSTSSCSVDVSLEEAFHFPQKISTRLPIEAPTHLRINSSNLKAMWCRVTAHFFEWVAGVPELRLLDVREKLKLVVRQYVKVTCLIVSYWTYRQGHSGMVMGCGINFVPTEYQDQSLKSIMSSTANILQNNVISIFQKAAITREEYLLIKLIVLFSTPHLHFHQPDRFIIDTALKKYQAALVDHIKRSYPYLDHNEVTGRVSLLLETIPFLEVVAQHCAFHWSVMTINNDGNIRGQLTDEIYIQTKRIFRADGR